MTKLKCWKKVSKNIWKKKNENLEIFQDTSWTGNYANVIIRSPRKSSYESSLGKTKEVKYFDIKIEAERFANKYMKQHDEC